MGFVGVLNFISFYMCMPEYMSVHEPTEVRKGCRILWNGVLGIGEPGTLDSECLSSLARLCFVLSKTIAQVLEVELCSINSRPGI